MSNTRETEWLLEGGEDVDVLERGMRSSGSRRGSRNLSSPVSQSPAGSQRYGNGHSSRWGYVGWVGGGFILIGGLAAGATFGLPALGVFVLGKAIAAGVTAGGALIGGGGGAVIKFKRRQNESNQLRAFQRPGVTNSDYSFEGGHGDNGSTQPTSLVFASDHEVEEFADTDDVAFLQQAGAELDDLARRFNQARTNTPSEKEQWERMCERFYAQAELLDHKTNGFVDKSPNFEFENVSGLTFFRLIQSVSQNPKTEEKLLQMASSSGLGIVRVDNDSFDGEKNQKGQMASVSFTDGHLSGSEDAETDSDDSKRRAPSSRMGTTPDHRTPNSHLVPKAKPKGDAPPREEEKDDSSSHGRAEVHDDEVVLAVGAARLSSSSSGGSD